MTKEWFAVASAIALCAPSVACTSTNGASDTGNVGPDVAATDASAADAPDAGADGSIRVAVGVGHLCVVNTVGALYCWGANDTGQLGLGYVGDMEDAAGNCDLPRYPERVAGIASPTQVAVGPGSIVGSGVSCALLNDGTVECWGQNTTHILGIDGPELPDTSIGPSGPGSDVPVPVPGLSNIRQIAVSSDSGHACALRTNGDGTDSVLCWGNNLLGEAGQSPASSGSTDLFPPAVVQGLDRVQVRAIRAGSSASCALMADGSVMCWGAAGDHSIDSDGDDVYTGYLGIDPRTVATTCTSPDGDVLCLPSATVVRGLTDGADIVMGVQEVCVLTSDGAIDCVGDDVGTGLMLAANEDTSGGAVTHYGRALTLPSPLTNVSALRAFANNGHGWACAQVATDWYCWGMNDSGVLAYDTGTVASIPASSGPTILSIASVAQTQQSVTLPVLEDMAVGLTMCGIGVDRSLWCWGASSSGQVAFGTSSTYPDPHDLEHEDLGVCNADALTL